MSGQSEFGTALLDASQPAPAGLRNPFGGPAGKRFGVYRNNVAASLTEALETGFPVIRKLVGDDFFKALAGAFLRAHPPEDPRLALYGGMFPGFLSRFDPVRHLPYLPDVARLELGLRQSYHAADATPLDVTGLPPAEVMGLAPRLAPATLVFASRFPVLSIWCHNVDPAAPAPVMQPETALITRPGFDPAPHAMAAGGMTLARALKGKLTLEQALTRTMAEEPGADVGALLSQFLTVGALTLDPLPPAQGEPT